VGLGRTQVLSLEGREEAAERWYAEFGPDTDMAKAAPSTCGLCGFYLPLAGSLRAAFGVCGNAMGADGRVVHAEYGCGAHSDTVVPTGGGSPLNEAYDDAAFDVIAPEAPRKPESTEPGADASTTQSETDSSTTAAAAEGAPIADSTTDVAAEPNTAVETTAVAPVASADVASDVVAEPNTAAESSATTPVSIEAESSSAEVASGADLVGDVSESAPAGEQASAVDSEPSAEAGADGRDEPGVDVRPEFGSSAQS
jgi:Protein of unknown function (DUF3027)